MKRFFLLVMYKSAENLLVFTVAPSFVFYWNKKRHLWLSFENIFCQQAGSTALGHILRLFWKFYIYSKRFLFIKTSSKWEIGISDNVGACGAATLLRCCGNVGIMRGSQAENKILLAMIMLSIIFTYEGVALWSIYCSGSRRQWLFC